MRGKQGTDRDEEEGHCLKHVSGPCQRVPSKQHLCEQYIYKWLLDGIGRGVPSKPSALMTVGAGDEWG